MKAREYAGPLGVLAAGAIGFILLCSVSAMAMGDLNNRISITMEPLNIVGLAVSNLETAAALTEQVVTVFVPTQTLVPTDTLSPAPLPSDTSTSTPRRFVTITPTATRRERPPFTPTSIPPTNLRFLPPGRIYLRPTPTLPSRRRIRLSQQIRIRLFQIRIPLFQIRIPLFQIRIPLFQTPTLFQIPLFQIPLHQDHSIIVSFTETKVSQELNCETFQSFSHCYTSIPLARSTT